MTAMASSAYRPEIDGLRAIAVLAVLFYHAKFAGFAGGYVGVDVFFVISGYLITGVIRQPAEQHRFSLAAFYERRARRLLPALAAVLALTTLAAIAIQPPALLAAYGRALGWTAISASNLYYWKSIGYFGPAADLDPLIHTWSLAVEEQYYLLYPVVLAGLIRWNRQMVVPVLAGTLAISLALSIWASIHKPMSGYYLLPTRAWELLAGALLALMPARHWPRGRRAELLCLLGLGMIAAATIGFDDATPFPGWRAAVPVLGTVLIIAMARPEHRIGRILASRPLVAIGLVSYSLYLIHQPVLSLARTVAARPLTPLQALVALIGSGLLAYASWRWVETPLRRPGSVVRQRRLVFAGTGAVVAIAAAGGLALAASNGLPQRFDAPRLAAIALPRAAPLPAGCLRDFDSTDAAPCVLGPSGARVRIAVMGDSHAWHLVPALVEVARANRWQIDIYAKSACPPGGLSFRYARLGRPYDECARWASAIDLPARGYDAVLLAGSGQGYAANRGDPLTPDRWQRHLAGVFDTLARAGVPTVWAYDTPQFAAFDPYLCVQRSVLFAYPGPESCHAPATDALDPRLRATEGAAAARYGVLTVDLGTLLCRDGMCPATLAGRPVMQDGNHITPFAALQLAPAIERTLRQALSSPDRAAAAR